MLGIHAPVLWGTLMAFCPAACGRRGAGQPGNTLLLVTGPFVKGLVLAYLRW
jgi:hypothetical protein